MSAAFTVKLPEALDAKQARKLGRELKSRMGADSPCVVIDFSRVKDIDLSGLEGLLACMDHVAKHDGALQLSGVSAEAATLMELTRMDQVMRGFAGFTIEAPQFQVAAEAATEEAPAESPVQVPVAA
jgi:anti-anti-sigma factor